MRIITVEEAREYSTIYEAFPEIEIKNSKLIEIIKEGIGAATLEEDIKKYLEKNAEFLKEKREDAGLRGLMETEALGTTRNLYRVGDKGKIIHDIVYVIGKYACVIRLINFDRRISSYRTLVKDFERFAKTDTSKKAFLRKCGVNPDNQKENTPN